MSARELTQIMRIAAIYALCDRSKVIKPVHLIAAKDLWDYCAASIKYLFGRQTGQQHGDRILDTLRRSPGMTTRDLQLSLGYTKERVEQAQNELLAKHLIRFVEQPTGPHGGRPTIRWYAVSVEKEIKREG